jgi:hypothetical protein
MPAVVLTHVDMRFDRLSHCTVIRCAREALLKSALRVLQLFRTKNLIVAFVLSVCSSMAEQPADCLPAEVLHTLQCSPDAWRHATLRPSTIQSSQRLIQTSTTLSWSSKQDIAA